MRVREWQDIVRDVVEADVDPERWKAVAGPRNSGLGEDLYLAHPRSGVFLLKTYTKNPFERKGVGTQVSRSYDDDIAQFIQGKENARFGVHPSPVDPEEATDRARKVQETVKAHAEAPTHPNDLFDDVMTAIDSPAFGPLSYHDQTRPGHLDNLAGLFDEADTELNSELRELIRRDEVDRGFH